MNGEGGFSLSEIQIIIPQIKHEVPMFEQTMSLLEMIKERKVRRLYIIQNQNKIKAFCFKQNFWFTIILHTDVHFHLLWLVRK